MAIKQFDRTNLRVLSADIQAALTEVGKKHGITVTVAVGRFSPTLYRTKIEATTGVAPAAQDRAKRDFDVFCASIGLRPEDFGKTFVERRTTYTIAGIKPRSHKYPVVCNNEKGAGFKFPVSRVLEGLGRDEEARKARRLEADIHEVDPEVAAFRRGLV